jgi:hypothetical protein
MPRQSDFTTHYMLVAVRVDKTISNRGAQSAVRAALERDALMGGRPVRVTPADEPPRAVRAKPPVVKRAAVKKAASRPAAKKPTKARRAVKPRREA